MTRLPNTPANPARRRGLLGAVSAVGGAALLQGCGNAARQATVAGSAPALDAATDARLARLVAHAAPTCSITATETEGPFPLRALLTGDALLRSDITEGKPGVPLALRIKLLDLTRGCTPLVGAWVYVWHCDRSGLYSGYDGMGNDGQVGKTYLRGIQRTDANGCVTFKTLYPGWYEGRITHVHCMVFPGDRLLSSRSPSAATTQFAFPEAATAAVYAQYDKGPNTSVRRLEDDNVFADGTATEMLALEGQVETGYAAGIVVGVDPGAVIPLGGDGPPPGGMPPPGGPGGPGRPPPPGMPFGPMPRSRKSSP